MAEGGVEGASHKSVRVTQLPAAAGRATCHCCCRYVQQSTLFFFEKYRKEKAVRYKNTQSNFTPAHRTAKQRRTTTTVKTHKLYARVHSRALEVAALM